MNGNDSLAYRLKRSRGQGSGLPPCGMGVAFFRSPLVNLFDFTLPLRSEIKIALNLQAARPSD